MFLIRKNVHKIQNILRITNKKEEQIEKRTKKNAERKGPIHEPAFQILHGV